MPRIARGQKSSQGIYHIMVRGNEKKDLFLDDEDRKSFIKTVARNQSRYGVNLYAYCLMTNHVHLLIGANGADISQLMKSINISYAMYFNRRYKRCGHLFQDRFKSELITTDAYMLEVSRYIHLNPARAGMVTAANLLKYPWSSYPQYVKNMTGDGLTVDAGFILEILSNHVQGRREKYIQYVMRDQEDMVYDFDKEEADVNRNNTEAGNEGREEVLTQILGQYNVTMADVEQGAITKNLRNQIVREIRKNTQLTLKQIGLKFGLSESSISKLLSG